mmetsp:Transcript_83251/g.121884  ORF Transcript_83251/g.121884 Transcript_83251/m.121884 type:complete len:89 (+) Transcript_83251:26-292(+)
MHHVLTHNKQMQRDMPRSHVTYVCNFLSFVLCWVAKARHICVVQMTCDDMSFMPRISLLHRESLMSCISLCHAAHLTLSCRASKCIMS